MKATHRLIDSVWTIEYNIVEEGKAEILKYTREDPEGYEKERQLPQGTVAETDKRIATFLYIKPYDQFNGWANPTNATEVYEIINPKHVFDYK